MATYDLTQSVPSANSLRPGDILNCPYSGAKITLTLPPGVFTMTCWGAQGGTYNLSYAAGGKGGRATATLTLTEQVTAYLYAGGRGTFSSSTSGTGGGGFNGGGAAGYRGGGGGGGADIRLGADSLLARCLVAGGGGGAYAYSSSYKADGGYAGSKTSAAADGSAYSSTYVAFAGKGAVDQTPGAGGTNSSATTYNGESGTFGAGGASHAAYSQSYYAGGGGGGGWYGGGGAATYNGNSRSRGCGGGGGNGWAATSGWLPDAPSGFSIPASATVSSATINSGNASFIDPTGASVTGRTGDGYIRIEVVSVAIAPGAPTSLTASNITQNSVTLSWTGDSLATSYKVSKLVGDTYVLVAENVTATTYTVTGLEPATDYSLGVRAVNDYGQSGRTTLAVTTAVPAPSYLTVYGVTAKEVLLTWPLAPTGSGLTVNVYRGTTLIFTGDAETVNYYTDIGRSPETTYTYKVNYTSSGGGESPAATVSATTLGSVFDLITDRTQADVNRVLLLAERGISDWTQTDKDEWNGEALKGAYNVVDILRVIDAMEELAATLNGMGFDITLQSSPSGWTEGAERPSNSLMTAYLRDLQEIRDALPVTASTPALPSSMSRLTYKRANNIEKLLLDVQELARLYGETMFPLCGIAACGGDYL